MTYEVITNEDLQKFRLQLLEDLKAFMQPSQHAKEWLKSSEVRKMLGISHGTLQNLRIKNVLPYQKIGGLMFYKYDDIIALLEANKNSKSVGDG
ncbi:helix-turn-helix domain-containing protein [Chryseolinea sp. H1M3-3]|uniref:helix-turn-helix domain-containing protein n=1 Tax=Chryseolinea sp. H1M3-3 TaxID=3034144 RepID=UPI0023EB2373|nr:helix-turn-helix domain-containing protein [Chryseolinea sp. H1M3-3]